MCNAVGACEPPEGWKERPTPHYGVKRQLNLNYCDPSTQVVQKCCFHNQRATLQVHVARLWLHPLVMKTTLLDHLSLGPWSMVHIRKVSQSNAVSCGWTLLPPFGRLICSCRYIHVYYTSKLKILRIKIREYRDGIKSRETRLGWD